MTIPSTSDPREKLLVNITPELRIKLKVRAAQCGLNVQDAADHAISLWYGAQVADVKETTGAKSWGVFLPAGGPDRFAAECSARGVTKVQGFAQAVELWLEAQPSPGTPLSSQPVQRILIANQKGGVGKTFVAAALAQAMAEAGRRVLLIDYDPQGHLTTRLNLDGIEDGDESLLTHMLGKAKKHVRHLLIALDEKRFGQRLHVLPACDDAFLLEAEMAVVRHGRETALERALESIEGDYDVVVIDGPPSLGLGLDTALNYVRRREGERVERSGVLIPVWADQSSHKAYRMLDNQIQQAVTHSRVTIDQLGIVVNAYDTRRGVTVVKNYNLWAERTNPSTIATFKDLKEGRESADYRIPLLEYAPDCELSNGMRDLAKELAA